MFYGTWAITVDDKKRIVLPAKFRRALGSPVIVFFKGRKAQLYPGKEIKDFPPEKFGNLWLMKIDKQGRATIPFPLQDKGPFRDKKLALVGQLDHFLIVH